MALARGFDIKDGFIEDTKSVFVGPEIDTTTGAIYELLFACVDEQAQTRGGVEGYGEHVVNINKIQSMQAEFEKRVQNYFAGMDGIVVESTYSCGGDWGYKDHYVFFKVKISQTLRSMWDLDIDKKTLGLADELSDLVRYLQTNLTDRTELILNALEHGKK